MCIELKEAESRKVLLQECALEEWFTIICLHCFVKKSTMGGPVCSGSFRARKPSVCIQISPLVGFLTSGKWPNCKWPKLFGPQSHLWSRDGKHKASNQIIVGTL